jgi:hypothetical protein
MRIGGAPAAVEDGDAELIDEDALEERAEGLTGRADRRSPPTPLPERGRRAAELRVLGFGIGRRSSSRLSAMQLPVTIVREPDGQFS